MTQADENPYNPRTHPVEYDLYESIEPGGGGPSDNLWFDRVLDKMAKISDSKRHDYASTDDPFLNFTQVADISVLTYDQVFMVWVVTKVVRLGQLVGQDKEPNNESIDDTIIDLANYAALWAGLRLRNEEQGIIKVYDTEFDGKTEPYPGAWA